jgi:signal peptidase I
MNWIPWLVVVVLCWIFIENPLQPKAWRELLAARKDRRRKKDLDKRVRKGPARYWLEFVGSIVLFLFFFRAMVAEAYRIPSGSMENTLLIGDFLLVNKVIYGSRTPDWVGIPFSRMGTDIPYVQLPALRKPRPGDILVFRYPMDPLVNYIKRLVAGPGQTIQVVDKVPMVDGHPFAKLPEQKHADDFSMPDFYADPQIFPLGSGWNRDFWGPVKVPQQGMKVDLDADSWRLYREAIQLEGHNLAVTGEGAFLVDGKPATSYTFEQNHYFMMGDNRDRSSDSRYWGFVPEKNIVGKAWIIYFSVNVDKLKEEFWQLIRWNRLLRFID